MDRNLLHCGTWLDRTLAELANRTTTPSSKQFATWHHLRRLRQRSAAGELSWGTTRVAKHGIYVTRNFLQHHSEQGNCPPSRRAQEGAPRRRD
jgi:hypothetical protein